MCFSSQTQRTPVQTISLPGTPSEEGGGGWGVVWLERGGGGDVGEVFGQGPTTTKVC